MERRFKTEDLRLKLVRAIEEERFKIEDKVKSLFLSSSFFLFSLNSGASL